MLKRVNWKAIFVGFGWVVCLSGLILLMSFIEVKKQEVRCTQIKIMIPGADNFIEREEINSILDQGFGQLIGRKLNDININEIEQGIKANPYIAFVKVYVEMDGVLKISVIQRQPVLRVINIGNQDFYVDDEGYKIPVSSNFTANVLVATGNIRESFSGKVEKIGTGMLSDLYKTAVFISKDTLWNAQIEQIYVDGNADIELIPRVGNQQIILGNADRLETKMNNLLIFYKKAIPKVGWDAYKTINLKYRDQIVCVKNNPDSIKKTVVSPASAPLIQAALPPDSLASNKAPGNGQTQVKKETTIVGSAEKKTITEKSKAL